MAAIAALDDGGTWAAWYGSDGVAIVSNPVPAVCAGTAHTVGVDFNQNTILAMQVDGSTDVRICSFNIPSSAVTYQQVYAGGLGTVQISDLAVLGAVVQVVFADNAGLHLAMADEVGVNVIDLADTDFTAEPVNGCSAAQLSPANSDAYLVEVCYSTNFGFQVAPMRAFTQAGQPFDEVVNAAPVSSNVNSLVALGLAMDPATFAAGPQAWIVGKSSLNGGFLAHYTMFGTTPLMDFGYDESSLALDAIAFASDGGNFAVLAENQAAVQVRTYTAVVSTATDDILAAGGQVSAASGRPIPVWPSGAGSGHALAWADDRTVFFITTEGLFVWRPFGP